VGFARSSTGTGSGSSRGGDRECGRRDSDLRSGDGGWGSAGSGRGSGASGGGSGDSGGGRSWRGDMSNKLELIDSFTFRCAHLQSRGCA
jgi:hypothetical protein